MTGLTGHPGSTDYKGVTVRLSAPGDAKLLSGISCASMTSAWSEMDFLDAMSGDHSVCLTAVADGTVAGYMVMYHAADEGEIPSVAVHESFRRRGVAHTMMTELFTRARALGLTRLFLEVRKSNMPAIAYYESFGFLCAGERKNFYSDPVEDALIYTTVINLNEDNEC